ncbi:MAG: zf-TFIIB domain-containing protein [Pseudomonadales bacterium]
MECPKCNARMKVIEFRGVEVDRCTQCNGLFFDHLERELLKKLEGAESIDIGDEFMGAKYDEVRNIDCPRCEVTMDEVRENDPFQIRFESCPKCRGAFFDAGEFRDYLEDEILTQFKEIVDKLG